MAAFESAGAPPWSHACRDCRTRLHAPTGLVACPDCGGELRTLPAGSEPAG